MDSQQQSFLRDTMRRLNLTREAFAARIGVSRRALDTWLLPQESQEFRRMPEIVQRFALEILGSAGVNTTHSVDIDSAFPISHEGKPCLLSIDQFSRDAAESLF